MTQEDIKQVSKEVYRLLIKDFKVLTSKQEYHTNIVSELFKKLNTGVVFSQIPEEQLLSTKELSEKLSCTVRFLYNEIEKGLPFYQIGYNKKFKYSEILSYYAKKQDFNA